MVIRRESGLSAQDLERFRVTLEQERRHRVDAIERLRREPPGAPSDDETAVGLPTARDREQAEYAGLARVNEALRRMIDGAFGLCEDCGRAIGQDRLEACPTCTLCVDCHERAESA